eukprot:scaffold6638_cov374-Prasinococcus_capsulatus_cf.AAC.4
MQIYLSAQTRNTRTLLGPTSGGREVLMRDQQMLVARPWKRLELILDVGLREGHRCDWSTRLQRATWWGRGFPGRTSSTAECNTLVQDRNYNDGH